MCASNHSLSPSYIPLPSYSASTDIIAKRKSCHTSSGCRSSSSFSQCGIDSKGKALPQLPDELLVQIFSYLGLKDLCQASLTCKRWYCVAKFPALYRNLYQKLSAKSTEHLPTKDIPWKLLCVNQEPFSQALEERRLPDCTKLLRSSTSVDTSIDPADEPSLLSIQPDGLTCTSPNRVTSLRVDMELKPQVTETHLKDLGPEGGVTTLLQSTTHIYWVRKNSDRLTIQWRPIHDPKAPTHSYSSRSKFDTSLESFLAHGNRVYGLNKLGKLYYLNTLSKYPSFLEMAQLPISSAKSAELIKIYDDETALVDVQDGLGRHSLRSFQLRYRSSTEVSLKSSLSKRQRNHLLIELIQAGKNQLVKDSGLWQSLTTKAQQIATSIDRDAPKQILISGRRYLVVGSSKHEPVIVPFFENRKGKIDTALDAQGSDPFQNLCRRPLSCDTPFPVAAMEGKNIVTAATDPWGQLKLRSWTWENPEGIPVSHGDFTPGVSTVLSPTSSLHILPPYLIYREDDKTFYSIGKPLPSLVERFTSQQMIYRLAIPPQLGFAGAGDPSCRTEQATHSHRVSPEVAPAKGDWTSYTERLESSKSLEYELDNFLLNL